MNETVTPFADISRDVLDQSDNIGYATPPESGLTEAVVRHISSTNREPAWMLEHRLKSLEIFRSLKKPQW